MRSSTAYLRDLFHKDIKSAQSDWYITVFLIWDSKLPILIVTPRIYFISLQNSLMMIISAGCSRLSADNRGEIKATGHLINYHTFKGFNKDWWAHIICIVDLKGLFVHRWRDHGYAELAHLVWSHCIKMATGCQNGRVVSPTRHLLYHNVEATCSWRFYVIWPPRLITKRIKFFLSGQW